LIGSGKDPDEGGELPRGRRLALQVFTHVDLFQIAVPMKGKGAQNRHSEVMAAEQSTRFGEGHRVVVALKRPGGGDQLLGQVLR
jgi:hypothetical protein